ncbi:MAG: hypothetical protein QOH90_1508 [Actinomycetota bacterium]|nr:hypothetical protein [Actinomycetota bacterium]
MNSNATASYVLPLRSREDLSPGEFTDYLRWIAEKLEVVVVDASDEDVFSKHEAAWSDFVVHVRPDPHLRCLNGKVWGVLTGLSLASHDKVVIADDDVRYENAALTRAIDLLGDFDLVRPQNYFEPLPWHARWDTARALLNRSFGRDFPGTLGVRARLLRRMGGYDGDVLFENLELMRSIVAAGGSSVSPLDLYVRRLPPGTDHFWSQRVRQAYDEFTLPARLVAFLSVVPVLVFAVAQRRYPGIALSAGAMVALAEVGRRRAGGVRYFPASTSWFAPAWVLERGICMWLALGRRSCGGVRYGDARIRRAATPRRELNRRVREEVPAAGWGL